MNKKFYVVGLLGAVLGVTTPVMASSRPSTAILVDKKTSNLYVTQYQDGVFKPIKTYHATLGKVVGDKEEEGDLKTPEGIYLLVNRRTSGLAPKLGVRAFNLNYPNEYDRMAGRTGSNILIHATNEPDRLKKDYDSEGCIVVKNEEILEIEPHIRVGLTPALVFQELTEDYWKPGKDAKLQEFFNRWLKSWESKDIATYINNYHTDFKAKGMNKSQWKTYKENLTKVYAEIKVMADDIRFYRHPKYSMVTFTQHYHSTFKGGATAKDSRGTKILFFAEEGNELKIIAEDYSQMVW